MIGVWFWFVLGLKHEVNQRINLLWALKINITFVPAADLNFYLASFILPIKIFCGKPTSDSSKSTHQNICNIDKKKMLF